MPAISARSLSGSIPSALVKTVWCEPPASSQASAAVSKSGLRLPDRAGDRELRERRRRRDDVDLVRDQAEAVAQVEQADDDRRPGRGREDEPDRVVASADRKRMDLARRPAGGDRGADLEHVRAEHERTAGGEIVGVVLHERGSAGEARGHGLEDPDEGGGLPVSLGAEAEPVGHQPLRGDPGKLGETVEILERVGERAEAAALEERAEPRLDPRCLDERSAARPGTAELGRELVALLVLHEQALDLLVRNGPHRVDEIADAVAVHREAEPQLRLDLVALGDRDLAHVVAEPRDREPLRLVPAAGRP